MEANDTTDYCPRCAKLQDDLDACEIDCETLADALNQLGAHAAIKDFVVALMNQNEAMRGALQAFGVHESLIEFITEPTI